MWNIFASNYVEIIKKRAYNQDEQFNEEECASARWTLHYLLERFLILAYPIIPQISSLIMEEKDIDLNKIEFPSIKKVDSELSLIEQIIDFNSHVWKTKKDKEISLRDPISGIKVPENLRAFEKDLKVTHGLK